MNLYEETVERLQDNGYTLDDIKAVFGARYQIPIENFLEVAKKTEFDAGYGAPEVAEDLVILLKDGAYMERREYDGSEWWEVFKTPEPPKEMRTVRHLAVYGNMIGWKSLDSLNKDEQGK